MQYRALGRTGLKLPCLSYGASSAGHMSRMIDLLEGAPQVRVALDLGINFFDTSPYYGRCMGEYHLGRALQGVPRDRYLLGTKLGRYDVAEFDFSARRVVASVNDSLLRLGVDYVDIMLCHDIEFVDLNRLINETLPALRSVQKQGKVRFIGVSGYPMKIFRYVLERAELDVVLSYHHYTLLNTMLADLFPFLQSKGVGIMNAAPFARRLLINAPSSSHGPSSEFQALCRKAAEHCAAQGVDIAQLALQFALAHPDLATCIAGSTNSDHIRQWAAWADTPIDQGLLADVLTILRPVHNHFHIEGRPENNDSV
jgi:L-galactose dehydrogenase